MKSELYSNIKWLTCQHQWKSFEEYVAGKFDRAKSEFVAAERDKLPFLQVKAQVYDSIIRDLKLDLKNHENKER